MEIRKRHNEVITITHFLPRSRRDDMVTREDFIERMRLWAASQPQYNLDIRGASFMALQRDLHRPQQAPYLITFVYGYFPLRTDHKWEVLHTMDMLKRKHLVTPEEVRFILDQL